MTSQTDPKNSVTTRTYDALNRLLTESNGGTTQVTNTYDTCTNGIGSLCMSSPTASNAQNSYDILGRVSSTTNTINGQSFTMSSAYDRQGNATTLRIPTVRKSPTATISQGNSRAYRANYRAAHGRISQTQSPTRRTARSLRILWQRGHDYPHLRRQCAVSSHLPIALEKAATQAAVYLDHSPHWRRWWRLGWQRANLLRRQRRLRRRRLMLWSRWYRQPRKIMAVMEAVPAVAAMEVPLQMRSCKT